MIQNTPDKCRGLVVRTGIEPVWELCAFNDNLVIGIVLVASTK
jgi:hypothetical protein